MPNFHTHWVVAVNAIGQAPKYVEDGWNAYKSATADFRDNVLGALTKVDTKNKAKAFKGTVEDYAKQWERDVGVRRTNEVKWYQRKPAPTYKPARDDITCFSAYMLGACGPDFWAVLSDTGWVIPDSALDQFNLGHYNRSHRQFQASIATVGNGDSLQARAQKAYFHGMATHLAADLVVHELVNVSAGAYNLLHELWISEQATGYIEKKKSWTMHNKVEHYWDTLVRYKYFGDEPGLAGGERIASGKAGNPRGFLTQDHLLDLARQLDPPRKFVSVSVQGGITDAAKAEAQRKQELDQARAELAGIIGDDAFKRMIEKPFLFPLPFADRVLDKKDTVKPFIYDVVVGTAHPTDDLHPVIARERTSPQMEDTDAPGGHSERHKLEFFSSKFNESKGQACSLNYLNFTVCPSQERAGLLGRSMFFDLAALRPFVDCGIRLATGFLSELGLAYEGYKTPKSQPTPTDLDAIKLDKLGRFWNLDTGLGLEVRCIGKTAPCEAVTILDFVHVFDSPLPGKLEYSRAEGKSGYLAPFQDAQFVDKVARLASASEVVPFPLRKPKLFNKWSEVAEPDDKAFLPRISVGDMPPRPLVLVKSANQQPVGAKEVDAFMFAAASTHGGTRRCEVPTKGVQEKDCVLELAKRLSRLTVKMRIRIPRLGAKPADLAMFLYADDDNTTEIEARMGEDMVEKYFAAEMTHWWLNRPEFKARLVDFHRGTKEGAYKGASNTDMQGFSTTLLSNFEPKVLEKADGDKLQWKEVPDRKIKAGEWNNVVPYGKPPLNKKNGRNYAIGTGRMYVLHPKNLAKGQEFAPIDTQLETYEDISPTEQVFFSLHVLVRRERDGTVWDAMTKTEVKEGDLANIRRIDAAGFVKIVLYFVLKSDGAFQLATCHVDGVPVQVRYEVSE
jgi:hypothetical protein